MSENISSFKAEIILALKKLVAEFFLTRRAKGAKLEKANTNRLAELELLFQEADALLPARREHQVDSLKSQLRRVLKDFGQVAPERVAQEIALVAIRSDVMKEIDRLKLNLVSAREMISKGGAIGRKMDFLNQE